MTDVEYVCRYNLHIHHNQIRWHQDKSGDLTGFHRGVISSHRSEVSRLNSDFYS